MLIAPTRSYVKLMRTQLCHGHRIAFVSVRVTSVYRFISTSTQSHASKNNPTALDAGNSSLNEATLLAALRHDPHGGQEEDGGSYTNATTKDGRPHNSNRSRMRYRRINFKLPSAHDADSLKKPIYKPGRQYLTSDLNKLTNSTLDFRQSDDTLKHRFIKSGRLSKSEIVERAVSDVKTLKGNQKLDSARYIDPFLDHDSSSPSDSSDAMDLAELFATLRGKPHPLQPGNEVQAQETNVRDAFDIFDAMGLKRGSLGSVDTASSQQGRAGKMSVLVRTPRVSHTRTEVDWKSLPLSPLIDKNYVAARNRFRTSKSKPSESIDYDQARGKMMSNDYVAQMLASHVRTCRLTRVRLPVEFLTTTIALAHPETSRLYEVPDGMAQKSCDLPTGYASEEEYVAAFVRQIEDSATAELPADQVSREATSHRAPSKDSIQEPEGANNALAKTKAENNQFQNMEIKRDRDRAENVDIGDQGKDYTNVEPENDSSLDFSAENTELGGGTLENTKAVEETPRSLRRSKSYILSTPVVFQGVVGMKEIRYRRTLPLQWQSLPRTGKGAPNFERRQDLDGFFYSLMQRQVTTELKNMRTLAWYKQTPKLGLCTTISGSTVQQIFLPNAFSHGTILYFGSSEDTINMQPRFSSTLQSLAASRPGITLLDDLFRKPQQSEAQSHAVRLHSKDWDSLIVYDLTRMLEPAFLKAVQAAGYHHLAYWMLPNHELLQRLWRLAHYVAPSR